MSKSPGRVVVKAMACAIGLAAAAPMAPSFGQSSNGVTTPDMNPYKGIDPYVKANPYSAADPFEKANPYSTPKQPSDANPYSAVDPYKNPSQDQDSSDDRNDRQPNPFEDPDAKAAANPNQKDRTQSTSSDKNASPYDGTNVYGHVDHYSDANLDAVLNPYGGASAYGSKPPESALNPYKTNPYSVNPYVRVLPNWPPKPHR